MSQSLYYIVAFICVVVFGSACASDNRATGNSPDNTEYVIAQNPKIPISTTIAGENVSFDREDMYERLDRELTSITYGHSNTMLTIKRANKYFPIIAPILKKKGIPDDFLYLAAIESSLNVRAYSGAGAAGLWQLLATTAREYGLEVNDEVDERYDPEKSTIAACKYLNAGYRKYGHWCTVAASYNAGMGRISKELEKQLAETSFDLYLNDETSRYVFRFIAMKLVMENPKEYGFFLNKQHLYQPVKYTEVEVSGPIKSWSEWAKSKGTSYAQLKELNPWIRAASLTNKRNKIYKVKIPVASDLYRSKKTFSVYNKNWVVND